MSVRASAQDGRAWINTRDQDTYKTFRQHSSFTKRKKTCAKAWSHTNRNPPQAPRACTRTVTEFLLEKHRSQSSSGRGFPRSCCEWQHANTASAQVHKMDELVRMCADQYSGSTNCNRHRHREPAHSQTSKRSRKGAGPYRFQGGVVPDGAACVGTRCVCRGSVEDRRARRYVRELVLEIETKPFAHKRQTAPHLVT